MLWQHYIGILSSQCCLNKSKTTLHKENTSAMLAHSPQTQKNNLQFCLDISGLTNYGVSWQNHNILDKFQSEFRKNHSTDFCLSYLTDKISKGFGSGLLTGKILIDLKKIFDTIDNIFDNILLLKMPSLGFSREIIDWYKWFLFSRKFHINVHGKFSTSVDLRCRVPQGSILGPSLFLLHINNVPQAIDCDLFLYADDLLFQYQDLERIKEELTKNFFNIYDWFVENKLNIHFGEDETKSILFLTKNRKRKIGTLYIQYGDLKRKQYSKVTYLGCELDESLSGEAMALEVINKIPLQEQQIFNTISKTTLV